MKKYDIYFAGIVLVIAVIISLWYGAMATQEGGQITITVEQKVYGTYLLLADQEIWINDTNLLVIKDGMAYMKDATCPNHDCVHQKAVSKKGEAITCLPNKVIIEVTGGEAGELDGVAN